MKKMTIEPKTIADPLALRGEMRKAFSLITGKWKLEILWCHAARNGCVATL